MPEKFEEELELEPGLELNYCQPCCRVHVQGFGGHEWTMGLPSSLQAGLHIPIQNISPPLLDPPALHNPCLLRVPIVRRNQCGYITPAFSGSP